MTRMAVSSEVDYEKRVRFRYGVIAFVGALMLIASQLIQLSGPRTTVNELTVDLIIDSRRQTLDIIGAILQMFGLIAVGIVLFWLFRVSRARNPQQKPAIRWLAIGGAVLSGVMAVASTVVATHKAREFVNTGAQGYPEADHLMSGALIFTLPLLLDLGALLLAVGCVLVSLNALRVGLTTRLVGYAGVVSGALFLISIPELSPLIEAVWLAALAVTHAARWPSGDPPAWEAGEARPWPPRASMQAAAAGSRAKNARVADKTQAPPKPRAGTPKRKRRAGS
jgi:hypothetical protein